MSEGSVKGNDDDIPFVSDSKRQIEKDAPDAIAYLTRTGNQDVMEILGLVKSES